MPYRFLNPDEAAQYLNLSRGEIDSYVKAGEIPFERRGDRAVFRRPDLDAWASRRILGFNPKRLAEYHEKSSHSARAELTSDALMPELIRPEQIDVALAAKTKPSVLRDMAALAARTGWVCDPNELIESLQSREALCSTAVPGGLAFLHPRAQQPYRFETSFVVVGRAVQPIHFGAPDGQPTDLFFLLCFQDDKLHLHVLARICLMALKTELLPELRNAATAREMEERLVVAEQLVIAGLGKKRMAPTSNSGRP